MDLFDKHCNKALKQSKLNWLDEVYVNWCKVNKISVGSADELYFRIMDGVEHFGTAKQEAWITAFFKLRNEIKN